ncbi:MAG TPA: alanine racemase [Phycisphaerales bacterium]|nr:alanine racemase [Phycisphaerales bacterium]
MSTSRVEIDLQAVDHNVGVLARLVGGGGAARAEPGAALAPAARRVGICAVVKQDAYGLGAVRIASRLAACPGVSMLAVYTPDEARALAEANIALPVLVLMPMRELDRGDPLYRAAAAGRVHAAIHDAEQYAELSEAAGRLGARLGGHLFVDTGLGRGGLLPEQAVPLVRAMVSGPRAGAKVWLAGLMTHFSSPCCDAAFTAEQARVFRGFLGSVRELLPTGPLAPELHAANTCGVLRSEKYHGTMVRVGQSLYGFGVEEASADGSMQFAAQAAGPGGLRPAVRWLSGIVHVKEVPAGFTVGYGATWTAPRRPDGAPTRLALVPVGYADGYPRALGNAGSVALTGRRWERKGETSGAGEALPAGRDGAAAPLAPVVGRVSMDQLILDVTDAPAALGARGMEVELAGPDRGQENFFPALARAAGSITHELLCRISPRVERVYRYPARAPASGAGAGPVAGRVVIVPEAERRGGGIGGASAVAR